MTARCKNCGRVIHGCECGACDGWRHSGGDHMCPTGWTRTGNPAYAEPVTRCRRSGCNRPLRAAASIAAGISPACAAKERAEQREAAIEAAIIPWSARQREDAKALIKAGKLKPLDRPGIYRVTSRDGKRTYFTSALGCPCASYGPCLHMAAAAIADAYLKFGLTRKAAA